MAKKKTPPAKKPSAENVVAKARGKAPSSGRAKSWAWENIKSLAGAILIYLVFKTFLIEAYRIPSGSMIPTLLVGDWLFVNKLVYGPVLPFTDTRLPGYSDPRRGEVAVFKSPPQVDQPEDPTPTLVKRIVGTPGDTLYMRAGLLYLNGIPQRQGYGTVHSPGDSARGLTVDPLFVWQHRIEVKGTRFGSPPTEPALDNWGPLVIPAGHYFMMGDNRYGSKDSRYWGIVPRNNFRGRPMFVYYSFVPAAESDRFLSFITDIRWGRLGHWIK